MKKISYCNVLDTRYEKETADTYPVRLRVTFQRTQKYYPTGHDMTEADWAKMNSRKPGELKDKLLELNQIEARAKKIIDKIPVFSFEAFKKSFLNAHDSATLKGAFGKYIAELKEAGREGTASSYNCSLVSLLKYKKDLSFEQINKPFLEKYKQWMLKDGNSISTVGMYLRALRAVFNKAILDGDIPADLYPFGKGGYKITSSRKAKKALTMSDIGAIVNYPATGVTEQMRDYWYFLYMCNGINAKDMCLLKYENLQGKFLIINRAKTINTETEIENIRIPLHEPALQIIEKYGRKKGKPEDYIFPILERGDDAETIHKKKGNLISLINDHMEIISDNLKLPVKVTTGYARGSFATILKRIGKSTEFIKEMLGHSSAEVTEHYLESFEDDTLHGETSGIIPKTAKVVSI